MTRGKGCGPARISSSLSWTSGFLLIWLRGRILHLWSSSRLAWTLWSNSRKSSVSSEDLDCCRGRAEREARLVATSTLTSPSSWENLAASCNNMSVLSLWNQNLRPELKKFTRECQLRQLSEFPVDKKDVFFLYELVIGETLKIFFIYFVSLQ